MQLKGMWNEYSNCILQTITSSFPVIRLSFLPNYYNVDTSMRLLFLVRRGGRVGGYKAASMKANLL